MKARSSWSRRTAATFLSRRAGTTTAGDEIRVQKDDLVRITFSVEDIPHSFTIDAYRISKRAEPGKPASFEFRADRAGTFEIYCNLTIDDQCAQKMKGRLVVDAK